MTAVETVVKNRLNGPLIAAAASLWIKPTDVVMDVTWGKGNFWTHYKHPGAFIAHDKFTLDGVDFRQLPEADKSIDVVVFDPPYISPGGRKSSTMPRFNEAFGLDNVPRTVMETDELIAAGIKECARVLAPRGRLLVKCMNYVNGKRLRLGHTKVVLAALDAGLEQADEFIHHSGVGAQPKTNPDGSERVQEHARAAHSFLCVFQALPARSRGRRPQL